MKYLINFLLIFLFSNCVSLNKKIEKNRFNLMIGLHSCFENDKIKVSLNDISLLNLESVTSSEHFSTTNITVYYYEKNQIGKIIINNDGKIKEINRYIDKKEKLILKVIRNNNKKEFNLKLKKGNRILVNGCDENRETTSISYYKKTIIID